MKKTLKDSMLDFVQEKGEARYTEIVEFIVDRKYGKGTYKSDPTRYRGYGSCGFTGNVYGDAGGYWSARVIGFGTFKQPSRYTRRFLFKNSEGTYSVAKLTKKGNIKVLKGNKKKKISFAELAANDHKGTYSVITKS